MIIATRLRVIATMAFAVVVCMLAVAPQVKAADFITSVQIADQIHAKCDVPLARYDPDKKDTAAFRNFRDACLGQGFYKPNLANPPERARRLLDVCSAKQVLTDPSLFNDFYNKGGVLYGGDCDEIQSSQQLIQLATTAYGGLANSSDPALSCSANPSSDQCDLIQKYINPIIAFLSAAVGLAVVIGIISGGIRFSTSAGDPQAAAAGRRQIRNAIIALVAYIFLYAIVQWIVPQDLGA